MENIRNDADLHYENHLQSMTGVKHHDSSTLRSSFTLAKPGDRKGFSNWHRQRGILETAMGGVEVWIEWRRLRKIPRNSIQDKECRVRATVLAQMLHINKPPNFCSPKCIGFINDRGQNYINDRYGWIFEISPRPGTKSLLRSLHSILAQNRYKPTLKQRIHLACKLASSLLYLQAANWLHNGFNSENIIFKFHPIHKEKYDADSPIVSAFEYSRPRTENWVESQYPHWDIYRWPRIQGEAPDTENCRKIFDIYSLGLVLLEVAHWRPLHEIMCLKKWPVSSRQDSRIRTWLLKEERFPPFKDADPLGELRTIAGDGYYRAVRCCIIAYGEEGMRVGG